MKKLNLLTDQAIGESDTGRDDGLGFEIYAQVLGDAAVGTDGPFVIGIFGEWGTGKTSLMKLMDKYLRKQYPGTITVWFNAWRFEKEEHPIVPLIATVIRELERNAGVLQKLGKTGKSLINSLRAVAYGFSAKSKVSMPGFAEFEAAFVAKDMIDRADKFSSDPLLDKSLYYDAFELLSKVKMGEKAKIVILIDDLDRCFPDMAIKLLESIKLVFGQHGFVFVLGVARSVIEGYLKHRYEIEYGLSGFEGHSYLDKIVQLPFYIPSHVARMDKFIDSLLEKIEPENKQVLKEILPVVSTVSASNPRTTIRFINNIIIDWSISKSLSEQKQSEEIPLVFFAVTRGLQYRWSSMFDLLSKSDEIRNWLLHNKDQIEQLDLDPKELDKSQVQLLSKVDVDFRQLIFSSYGIEWLKNDQLRTGAIQFLHTQRPIINQSAEFTEIEGANQASVSGDSNFDSNVFEAVSNSITVNVQPTTIHSSRLIRKTVMISSTARDLPKHREEVMSACLSQGMFPVMMEHLPANDDDAISTSLKMVDEADIYVGVFAQRYGYIPKGKKTNPQQISITEMEYNRAVSRGIPCLIFVMDKDHPIRIDDIEMGIGGTKLQAFKKRLLDSNIVSFFKSPAELRGQVINSLSKQLEPISVTSPGTESLVIDLTAYFNALRKRYNVLALEGLTPPQKEEYLQIQLRSVFVEQSVREDALPVELPKEVWEKLSREQEIHDEDLPSGITLDDVHKARESYYQKPSQLVLDALTDSKTKYAIILGDPGSGKSTLARYIMLSLIDPALAGNKFQKAFEGYLPLLIELRTFAGLSAEGKSETPLEFLEHLGKTEGWGLTQSALQSHLKGDGRAVVIFDGLDEIFEPKLRETITNQIVGFTNAYPKARVIVTSRILGYRRKILSDAGFTHFTLQDLNEEQARAFITKWYDLAMSDRPDEAKERSERILKSFADSASIRQLAGNPMLLTIIAIIGKHQDPSRERWKLYDHATSVFIQHWDVNKHLKDERIEADFIGEDDKKELLRRLAFRMQTGDGGLMGNYMHREALQEEFETYLKERYSQDSAKAKVVAKAMIQQFRERNFILSQYGASMFGFVNRAFLEYFCASAFVWKFEKTKELTIEQLKSDVYWVHWKDQSWHEVLRLICGMLDEKWTVEIVIFLIDNLEIILAIECFDNVTSKHSRRVVFKHWSNHPDALALLRERAENDPTPWLREKCKELIDEIEKNKGS